METAPEHRRKTDGWFGWFTAIWDFIDNRDIDKHFVSLGLFAFLMERTVQMTRWSWRFADNWIEAVKVGHAISGTEVAAVAAANWGPWGLVLSTSIPLILSFYFKSRPS